MCILVSGLNKTPMWRSRQLNSKNVVVCKSMQRNIVKHTYYLKQKLGGGHERKW